jgi:hypothetical protein
LINTIRKTIKENTSKQMICPECKKGNIYWKEIHQDTDMNDVVLYCPECRMRDEDHKYDNLFKEKTIKENYITRGYGYELRVEDENDIKKIFINNDLVIECKFGKSGADNTKIYKNNIIADVLLDIIEMGRR